jgi:hypothetical protein
MDGLMRPYMKTKSGLEAKVIYTLNNPDTAVPVIVILTDGKGIETCHRYMRNLQYEAERPSDRDIIDETLVSMDRKYRTVDGTPARILCIDADNKQCPVIALIDGAPLQYTAQGIYYYSSANSLYDLIEVK